MHARSYKFAGLLMTQLSRLCSITASRRHLQSCCCVSISTIWISLCCAANLHAKSLESDSPFLPPEYNTKKAISSKPQPTSAKLGELEFRGVVQIGGNYQFSLHDKKLKRSYWIATGAPQAGISVENFDPTNMSLLVTKDHQTRRLILFRAHELPISVKQVQPATASERRLGQTDPAIKTPVSSRIIPRQRIILPTK
jgi:hypothetical protein